MPADPSFLAWLDRALRGTPARRAILSGDEADEVRRRLRERRLLPEDVSALLLRLRTLAAADSLELDPPRRARLDALLTELDAAGLVGASVARPLLEGLLGRAAPPEVPTVPEVPEVPAPTARTLAGRPLQLDGDALSWGERPISSPAALRDLSAALRGAADLPEVAAWLGRTIEGLDVPTAGAGRLATAGALLDAAEALVHLGGAPASAAGLAERAQTDPRPLLAAALGAAAQASGAAVPPHTVAPLVERARALLTGALDGLTLPGPAVAALRAGLAFSSTVAGGEALLGSVRLLTPLSTTPGALDAELAQLLADTLTRYVDASEAPAFTWGKWPDELTRARSDLQHARTMASVTGPNGSLTAAPPTLRGLVLDPRDAAALLPRLAVVRDAAALDRLVQALQVASELFPGRPTVPGAAYAIVDRALTPLADAAEAAVDRRSDLTPLVDAVRAAMAPIAAQVRELHQGLQRGLAGAVRVDAATAAWLKELAAERLASERSLPNLLAAVAASAVDGALADPAGFRAFLDSYLARWPERRVFDFNKLERLARAWQTGDTTPLYQLNGAEVDPGRFHVAVAEQVKRNLQHTTFPQRWIPHRFAYRARQAAELIDLLAERAAQGRGPIAALRQRFPAAPLRVLATTSDMEYNSLIYQVETEKGTETWYMSSDGEVHIHARAPEAKHVLFSAEVDARGGVHAQVAAKIPLSPRAWPLMNTYGVGDRIDVEVYDADEEEKQKEKERFQTRYRVHRGTIVAFDDMGNHEVDLELDGALERRTVNYEQIRTWNNPHVVPEEGGFACTVRFNRSKDAPFAASMEKMEAIARQHGLPEFDLAMAETALAQVQKRFLRALNSYTRTAIKYPNHPPTTDADRHYEEELSTGVNPMGAFLEVARGVCRHQFIHEHMGKQAAGIDERFASGAANTYAGDFRGLHIWGEVSLADRSRLADDRVEPGDPRFLSDATWGDAWVPLWEGAYGNDLRRVEMYERTSAYAALVVRSDLR